MPSRRAAASDPAPPEAQLLQEWLTRTKYTQTELARRVTRIGEAFKEAGVEEFAFTLPESTLRNMLEGRRPATLAPPWRLAACALVCDGTPQELLSIGRGDSADLLVRMRTALDELHNSPTSQGDTSQRQAVAAFSLPDSGHLLVSVPEDLTDEERDLVRQAALSFAETIRNRRS